MDMRRAAFGLMALLAALFLGLRGVAGGQPVGIDLNVGREHTRLVLTAPILRLAFDFEHDRPKTNSGWGNLS